MLLFLSTCFAFILPVESWWDTGHMLTAAIALKNLKKAKVVEATNLLSNLPGYTNFGSDFVSASHWADDIKRNHDAYAFSSWHFIDFPYPNRSSCSQETVEEQNIVSALEDMRTNLLNNKIAGWNRAFSLRYTIHLMGDIHQPLHCVSRCSSKHPKGDFGGNLFKLNDKDYTNLHKLWDAMGGAYKDTIAALCPYSDISVCKSNEPKRVEAVKREADAIMADYPMNAFTVTELNQDRNIFDKDVFMKWAESSYNVVKTGNVYGNVVDGGVPSSDYIEYVKSTTRKRVALGGYRLAILLNANLAESGNKSSSGINSNGNGNGNDGLVAAIVILTVTTFLLVGVIFWLAIKLKKLSGRSGSSPSSFEML